MQFEKIFTSKIDLPTPPPTPLCEDNIFSCHDDTSQNDDVAAAEDLEVFNLNFTLQDLVSEINGEPLDVEQVVGEDIMWGRKEILVRSETSTPSLVKSLRERSLVTPLNFDYSNLVVEEISKSEEGYKKKLEVCSESNWIPTECLLTPAEIESDCEIDVVGGAETKCGISEINISPRKITELSRRKMSPTTVDKLKSETFFSEIGGKENYVAVKSQEVFDTTFKNKFEEIEEIVKPKFVLKSKKLNFEKNLPKKSRRKSVKKCCTTSSEELSSDSSPLPYHRRGAHNNLERKRRDDLKRKFDDLKNSISDLSYNERIPKVVILKKACDWIHCLHIEERELLAQKHFVHTDNINLIHKVNALQQQRYNGVPKFYYS